MNNHPRRRQNFGSQPETDDYIAFDHSPEKNRPEMNTQFEAVDLRHVINAAKAANGEVTKEPNLTATKPKVDRLGIFNGADNAVDIGDVRTVFTVTQEVKPEIIKKDDEDVIDLCDSDDDDEIEMVAVVTNDSKKFKCIKLEDEEENKKRNDILNDPTSISIISFIFRYQS